MHINIELKSFLKSREAMVLFFLLALGAAARIYGAWCLRHNLNLDAGVVALMAKHISEGVSFPVFFYGQAYMGSLEAYVSAFFMKVFGLYGFGVTLGTAFFGFLLLPVIYAWARDIAGTRAGYATLLFCIIGSWTFFYYGIQPRGGYAACILFGTLSLWMSVRIAERTLDSGSLPRLLLFSLGIVAGLGWWANQLIAAALFSSALVLIIVLRRQVFSSRLLLGFAGFFLGSFPFWIYNIQHDWATFAFSRSFGQVSFLHGLKLFFVDRFIRLVGLDMMHPFIKVSGALLYLFVFIIGLLIMIQSLRKNNRRAWISLLAIYIFISISAFIFSTSHFAIIGDSRYLLPIYPFIAILLGISVNYFSMRLPRGLAWIPLLALVALQFQSISFAWQWEKNESTRQLRIDAVRDFMMDHHINAGYAHQSNRAWTFATKEQVVFSDFWGDFYPPNARHVELSGNPAVLDNYGEVNNYLRLTQGFGKSQNVRGAHVYYHFSPPVRGLNEIPAQSWGHIRNMTDADVLDILANPVYPKSWYSPRRPHEDFLEVAFQKPVEVAGVRMLSNGRLSYPRFLQIEVLPTGAHEWVIIHKASGTGSFFWSGNRPYPFGRHYRLEAFFKPVMVEKMRIVNKADKDLRSDFRWGVQLLQIFGPGPAPPKEEDFFPDLVRLLQERGIEYLYSDRWVANSIFQATNGKIWTPLDTSLFPESNHPLYHHLKQQFLLPIYPERVMLFNADTALLARWEDVFLVRRCLDHTGLQVRETVAGPWVLFDFPEADFSANEVFAVGLNWTGFGCIPAEVPRHGRIIQPELAKEVGFFYPDNNWTTGNLLLSGLNYKATRQDRYLRLALKEPHPHGNDAKSLGITAWINRTRLPLAHENGLNYYFWVGSNFNVINSIRIQSNTFVPASSKNSDDMRSLGLMVESIALTDSLPENGDVNDHLSGLCEKNDPGISSRNGTKSYVNGFCVRLNF